jgi:hypothetical protein
MCILSALFVLVLTVVLVVKVGMMILLIFHSVFLCTFPWRLRHVLLLLLGLKRELQLRPVEVQSLQIATLEPAIGLNVARRWTG